MECEESVNLVGSQCYVIGKIHDQKLAKQPKDHIIKNDVTMLDGEIVVGN